MTDLFDFPAVTPDAGPTGRRAAARKRAAARRRRRRRLQTSLIVIVVLAVVGVVAYNTWDGVSGLLKNPFAADSTDYPGPGGGSVEVEVPEGATGTTIGQVLHEADVVASVGAFKKAWEQNPASGGIQPGTYALRTKMKASDAVAALVKNEKVETKVTIPEGFIATQVLDRITSVTGITKEDLDAAIADPASIGLPDEAGGNVEGWLFPATYTVTPKDTATTVLSQMIAKTIAELDAQGVAPENRLDILKKASIVEKEAPAGFFGQVARVIDNRLYNNCDANGGRLGMDAIDAYGLGIPASELTKAQLYDADLPYASRKHPGLPPTPIGNPGTNAIVAAVNPPEGTECWYVTVNTDTGETKFADTYAGFQEIEAEYKAWLAAKEQG